MANENQYYKTPFANSGTRENVPDTSVGGNVGFDTGYGPDYELAQGDPNRKRIPRGAHNELLYGLTKNTKQWQENNFPTWIEDDGTGNPFSYDKDVIVSRSGAYWISTEGTNTDEPGVGAKWEEFILGNLTSYVKNRWVGNQNFNVLGKDGYPLLDGTPQDILAGNEIAAGIIALTDCLQMTKINGVINSASNTGIIRRSYPKDDAGEITKNSQYCGFKDHLDAQIQADVDAFSAGGARITDDASNVYGAIDLSIATDGLQFLFLADEPGIIENVSDDVSLEADTIVTESSPQVSKAFVSFKGTGTVTINDSFNVSSVADNGTGDYTVNFETPLPDVNYAVVLGGNRSLATTGRGYLEYYSKTISSVQVASADTSAAAVDFNEISVSIFSSN